VPSVKLHITPSVVRLSIDIILLSVFSLILVISPVFKEIPNSGEPKVLAYYVDEFKNPIPKGISAPALTATGVYVEDLDSGVVLYDKNPHEHLRPASLTKIMTSLVAMDYYSEDSVLAVKNGQNSLGNTANLLKGDLFVSHDMLAALLIPSGNDAAVTLAENYPGGYTAFLKRMNTKLVEMGLTNTHFANVSGVESPAHYTSAYDIAQIAKTALHRSEFASIVSSKKLSITSLKGHIYELNSTNVLLGKSGIEGVKTGWTPEAGECLVVVAEQKGHKIIISILNSKDRFGEGKSLVDWVFKNFDWE